ncbi:MAG TPA: hypothetical protein VD838_08290 [Anaeromyxobacteraceae bacterium]|nr:hypothetical protein [Anaeromyxobacteraceae bacterium]
MRHALLSLAVLAATALTACAPRASIPDPERERVGRELTGQRRWLRAAAYSGPFFGDLSKKLLTDQPAAELDLLETAGGDRIAPPTADRILPPGTEVRIRSVEFPTGWTIARRIVMTPRYHPWVFLEVEGSTDPHVLVLPQTAATFEAVRDEIDRLLVPDDPSSAFEALSAEHRDAIRAKRLVDGMTTRAVEMSWGLPERKRIDRPARTEEWTWPGGTRRAFFEEDRLVRWEPRR